MKVTVKGQIVIDIDVDKVDMDRKIEEEFQDETIKIISIEVTAVDEDGNNFIDDEYSNELVLRVKEKLLKGEA